MTIQSIDTQLLLFINHAMENAAFDVLMPALSSQGYLLVIPFLLAMFAQAINQTNEEGKTYFAASVWTFLIACCAVYLAGLAEDALKMAVARERPCRTIEGIRLIIPCPSSFSLPSGHAISSFAFAAPLFYLTRYYIIMIGRLYPLLLASLIAFSRVYLGVHYPMDVLSGALLGSVIGLGLSVLYQLVVSEYTMILRKK
jgi:undecaprenyl-diphosphatase